jgi:soluble lytic murein transglycosylase-like protein
MAALKFDTVKAVVAANNRATNLSAELIICLIWKESGFDPAATNASSSATGLMQITRAAVDDVNANTPKGTHFDHSDMSDPAQNVQCGSYYLELRIKRVGGDVKKGIERFGTGSGYADNLLACEACMKGQQPPCSADQLRPCLFAIHS